MQTNALRTGQLRKSVTRWTEMICRSSMEFNCGLWQELPTIEVPLGKPLQLQADKANSTKGKQKDRRKFRAGGDTKGLNAHMPKTRLTPAAASSTGRGAHKLQRQ